jgi:hypothetical protein
MALPRRRKEPGMSILALPDESIVTTPVTEAAAVPAELLPECTCILGDCDRDHDNE